MESILLVVHVIVALLIVGLIMLQQGKGAEMGASFGSGGSQTVFGAAGTGNFFSRLTAILVAVFFATSFVLAMIAQKGIEVDDVSVPVLETPAIDVPSVDVDLNASEVPETLAEELIDEGVPVEEVIESEVPDVDAPPVVEGEAPVKSEG